MEIIIIILLIIVLYLLISFLWRATVNAFTPAKKGRYNPKDDEDWIKSVNNRKNPYV